jgi:hypothetical protein
LRFDYPPQRFYFCFINIQQGIFIMKKVFQILALLAVTATVFTSCRTRTDCPAYRSHSMNQPQQESRF